MNNQSTMLFCKIKSRVSLPPAKHIIENLKLKNVATYLNETNSFDQICTPKLNKTQREVIYEVYRCEFLSWFFPHCIRGAAKKVLFLVARPLRPYPLGGHTRFRILFFLRYVVDIG